METHKFMFGVDFDLSGETENFLNDNTEDPMVPVDIVFDLSKYCSEKDPEWVVGQELTTVFIEMSKSGAEYLYV